MRFNRLFVVVLGAVLALGVGSVQATIYVAAPPFGSDLNGDGSPTAPYETIQHAYNVSPVQGEEIVVAPGTFNECVVAVGQSIEISPGVFEEKWVHIRANNPDPALTTIVGDGLCTTVTVGGLGGGVEGFTITGGGSTGVHGIGNVSILDNVIDGNTGLDGGGIQISSSTCTHGAGNVTISGNVISNNHSTDDGGGIHVLAGIQGGNLQCDHVNVVIQGNTVTNNLSDDDGGGMHVTTTTLIGFSAEVTILQNTVQFNQAVAPSLSCCARGGGIRARIAGGGTETMRLIDNIVDQNEASWIAGGIEARIDGFFDGNHTMIVDNNTVTNNLSGADAGGMRALVDAADMLPGRRYDMFVTNNLIDGNTTVGNGLGGGGLLAQYQSESSLLSNAVSGIFLIRGNIVTNNSCDLIGGGMSISAEANVDAGSGDGCDSDETDSSVHIDVENNLVARNRSLGLSPPGKGGGVAVLAQACTSPASSGTVRFMSNTIADNEVTVGAGGIEVGYFSAFGGFTGVGVSHSVIANNQGVGLGGSVPSGNYRLDVDHSNVFGNASANYSAWIPNPTGIQGNITAVPHFVDPLSNDYRLLDTSPMIDQGRRVPGPVSSVDFEGDPRVADGDGDGSALIDMGYDEFWVCTDDDSDTFGDPIVADDTCEQDNCASDFNPGQSDCDVDLIGDACDPDTVDADEDGVDVLCDSNDLVPTACLDVDADTCDDCTSGVANPRDDGLDTDYDGQCDAGDPDDDNDGIDDGQDVDPLNPDLCRDTDGDGCDDCSSGVDDAANDGADFDLDGQCDLGDPDDDDDGIPDELDSDPLDNFVCADSDFDTCEDCSGGSFDPANDGTDADGDGSCSAGDSNDADPNACGDADGDTCEDCITGTVDTLNDGSDFDVDGLCDAGDPDDDNDGVDDLADSDPFDAFACSDIDNDTCEDCTTGPETFFQTGFDADEGGLVYQDDTFRGTTEPAYADGTYEPAGGLSGGGLRVILGGVDSAQVSTSGGWVYTLDLAADSAIELSFSYNLTLAASYESDELGQVLLSVDGTLIGGSPNDYVAEIVGDDDPGTVQTTGWQQFQVDLGPMSAGPHIIIIGGYNNKKSAADETTEVLVDDLVVTRFTGQGFDPANDGFDFDTDGVCDAGDPDDDNDGVDDGQDAEPMNPFACRDADADLCDDCTSGMDDVANDGPDNEPDGLCDAGDPDDDNDGVEDGLDSDPLNRFLCRDADADTCEDCSSGVDDVANDGLDTDADGACDAGDADDDNDGVDDGLDSEPLNEFACRDADADLCDDCTSGVDNVADDGLDTDSDGACDAGDADDDNDGVDDGVDPDALDPNVCGDSDGDSCDDCTNGTDGFGTLSDVDPANDGLDTDSDGACDAGDADDDNDGVDDGVDPDALDPNVCGDSDGDSCDDCTNGTDGFGTLSDVDPANDGLDTDSDGACDAGDPDDDNDGVDDGVDPDALDPNVCGDSDGDSCDDCTNGTDGFGTLSDVDPANDGLDTDADGACDAGDPDDDNDGVDDGVDPDALDPNVCGDSDGDSCDDCTNGTDGFGTLSDVDPANDGLDTDSDGACDAGDPDDDNDGVDDGVDPDALDPNVCGDSDGDSCDDCTNGTDGFGTLSDVDPANDGLDTDSDGACDAGDPDDDNDGVDDGVDPDALDPNVCGDSDGDSCDDCTNGTDGFGTLSDVDPANDGLDTDSDGACDAGDPDDDNDGVDDGLDAEPLNEFACRDADADLCDDCTSGVDDVASDGLDTDSDGACDTGDPDDDNDGVDDGVDPDALDPNVCGDSDGDSCDDCTNGTDGFGTLSDVDPANDGLDTDSDGACDAGDPDDDNDGVDDGLDSEPLNQFACRDADADLCDDCTSGVDDVASDGLDTDSDGACDTGDPDDDNDGVDDGVDPDALDPNVCGDSDGDSCDDCTNGTDGFGTLSDVDPANDGLDTDSDGACDAGDPDDDNDGVDDGLDSEPLNQFACRDADADLCDDCTSGVDDVASDGLDTDSDGACDTGDPDDDNDGVDDGLDSEPLNEFACRDADADLCDDCTSGSDDPANDGLDTDTDGACDAGDPDDDNDGVDDGLDSEPLNQFACRDADADLCDDCTSGSDDPANDGLDTDSDGACDAGDPDDDNDGVDDGLDSEPLNQFACRDADADLCDDCTSGVDDVASDGLDTDSDGACDAGDPDDDNDGVDDGLDSEPLNQFACRDADADLCDDCTSGTDDPANDGLDSELDGLCDAGDPDDDNDGVDDGADCAPLVNSVSAPAQPLDDSLRAGPDNATFMWLKQANANVYNVYRGSIPAGGSFGYNHTCLASEVTDIQASDPTVPGVGQVLYYLVSGTNVCSGDGGLGQDSSGADRPNDSPCVAQGNDSEGDGILDINDNCPLDANTQQADNDLDGRGNACDNCPDDTNLDQADSDMDGPGDVCDLCTDLDDDGFGDPDYAANTCQTDNCPMVPNPSQADQDADNIGNACDACIDDPDNDLDADGVCGDLDNCPATANFNQIDGDGDGIGDVCDACTANPDTGCVACPNPETSDPDADGACQVGGPIAQEGTAMDYLANAGDPGIGLDWIEEGYPLDASWQAGVFGIGYDTSGVPNAQNLISTPAPVGTRSVYSLLTFDVASALDVDRFTVSADYDDGYMIWVNGVELFRSPEMPDTGDPAWDAGLDNQTESSNGFNPDYGPPNDVTAAAQTALHDGTNTLAIGLWNASSSSSDLVIVPLVTMDTSVDNCPNLANPSQADTDTDGVGDDCDNCINDTNFAQVDGDADGLGDACDPCPSDPDTQCGLCPPGSDPDGDGVCQIESVLVEEGSSMDYLANSSSPGLALDWVQEVYPLGPGWQPGIFGVGYETSGPPNAANLISTPVADTASLSIYTRAEFEIVDIGEVLRVLAGADWDDGFVMWVNGAEVHRSAQMPPTGDPDWNTLATPHESSNQVDPDYGTLIDVTAAAQPQLHNGTNVVAVGVWNSNSGSSDLVVVPRLSINTTIDNCPNTPNPGQEDTDGDGIGDACDPS